MKDHVMLPVPDNPGAEARAILACKKNNLPCGIEIVGARRSSNEDSGLAVRHEPGIDRALLMPVEALCTDNTGAQR